MRLTQKMREAGNSVDPDYTMTERDLIAASKRKNRPLATKSPTKRTKVSFPDDAERDRVAQHGWQG
jgi:hypothetical protein